ncbi:uncharacterized protein, partial [Haliotis asinina]|uniref:uncharacterized protein n=1 Tax=Haliotis asinina TaxID=109174 RepID=UPI0035323349
QGAVAKTCVRGYLNCLFGCCTDGYFIYCCLSNGAGFGIIFGVIVMAFSTCAICFCLRRHHAPYSHRVAGQQTVNVSGTTVMQSHTAQYQPNTAGYGQPNTNCGQQNTGYGQPNTGYGQPNPGYGQPNMSYTTPPPPYSA